MNIKIAVAGSIAGLLFLSGCASDSDETTTETTSAIAAPSDTISEAPMEEPGTIVDVAAAVTAGEVATVEGSTIEITTDDGVMVNEATVVATDVEASNGVIHVIDAVIVPPTVDVTALLDI